MCGHNILNDGRDVVRTDVTVVDTVREARHIARITAFTEVRGLPEQNTETEIFLPFIAAHLTFRSVGP
jgi:hypothetical protein